MKRFKLIIIGLILILSLTITALYTITLLQVYIADKGPNFNKILIQLPAKTGEKFDVRWIHSVSRRPVIETYKIEKDLRISIFEMKFDTFSANLPASPDYNTKWEYHKDYIRVYNYDVLFDAVPVVIGKVVADHTLYFRDKVIHLKDVYKPGGYVKIRVVKDILLNYLIKEAFN
ncbi:MAG: hypothetical protein PWQ37_3174 [Candidatus Petromonas sp.]|jgi:hypothetical protein|nr:hypothetical protein [Candidatus Petromonas sp.]